MSQPNDPMTQSLYQRSGAVRPDREAGLEPGRARTAAQPQFKGHRSLFGLGRLFVFMEDGYEPGERVLFVTFRLPRLRRG